MNLEQRITAFARLGTSIRSLPQDKLDEWSMAAARENPWFTHAQIVMALEGIAKMLDEKSLRAWVAQYSLEKLNARTVGVAMAGNIPAVGFHDFLCVLIAGHRLKVKLSSQDSALMVNIIKKLIDIEPGFSENIQVSDKLLEIDAMIATGSDNTARYFEYYFRNIPHIIRKNRSSCAVIMGEESESELTALGQDVFSYFGLGCRNISKLYVPHDYDFAKLFKAWIGFAQSLDHHKYFNNYDYQKTILLVNKVPFYDNGFVLLKEDTGFVSPISVLYYEYYTDQQDLRQKIEEHKDRIQCVVSARQWFNRSIGFGLAQFPEVNDFADRVDTLAFLSAL